MALRDDNGDCIETGTQTKGRITGRDPFRITYPGFADSQSLVFPRFECALAVDICCSKYGIGCSDQCCDRAVHLQAATCATCGVQFNRLVLLIWGFCPITRIDFSPDHC